MSRRPSYYLLIFVATVFIALKCVFLAHNQRLLLELTEADYIEFSKIVVALVAIALSVFFLVRERQGRDIEALDDTDGSARFFSSSRDVMRKLPSLVTGVFAHHPILATLMSLVFLAIPVGLRTMGTVGGWKALNFSDWILIGLAEAPFVGTAVFVVFWSLRNK